MKKKIKSHMDTYETIYPVTLVVANEAVTLKEINKYYTWPDGCEVEERDLTDGNPCAVTFRLLRKSDGARVAFVKFIRHDGKIKTKQDETNSYWTFAVHEACHVALFTYSVIGDEISKEYSKQEPFYYYTQWVAQCIYETISKK